MLIDHLSQQSAPTNSNDFYILVYGSDFGTQTTAQLNSVSIYSQYLNSSTMLIAIPSAIMAQPSSNTLLMINAGTNEESNEFEFDVQYDRANVSTTNAQTGVNLGGEEYVLVNCGDTALQVNGSGFYSGVTQFYIGQNGDETDTQLTNVTFVNDGYCVITFPGSLFTSVFENYKVSAFNPVSIDGNGGGGTANLYFNCIYPSPAISSISPTTIAHTVSSCTITINGTGFYPGCSAALYGKISLNTTFVSNTKITASFPANSISHLIGNNNVSVGNVIPTVGTSNLVPFAIT